MKMKKYFLLPAAAALLTCLVAAPALACGSAFAFGGGAYLHMPKEVQAFAKANLERLEESIAQANCGKITADLQPPEGVLKAIEKKLPGSPVVLHGSSSVPQDGVVAGGIIRAPLVSLFPSVEGTRVSRGTRIFGPVARELQENGQIAAQSRIIYGLTPLADHDFRTWEGKQVRVSTSYRIKEPLTENVATARLHIATVKDLVPDLSDFRRTMAQLQQGGLAAKTDAFVIHGWEPPQLTITGGPVRDGEAYAPVWTPGGATYGGFLADGKIKIHDPAVVHPTLQKLYDATAALKSIQKVFPGVMGNHADITAR